MFWFHLSSPALQCLPIISTKLQITRSVEAPGLEFPRNFECAEWFRSLTSPASEERLLSNYTALIPAAKNCLFFFFHVFFYYHCKVQAGSEETHCCSLCLLLKGIFALIKWGVLIAVDSGALPSPCVTCSTALLTQRTWGCGKDKRMCQTQAQTAVQRQIQEGIPFCRGS